MGNFLKKDLWQMELSKLPPWKAVWYRSLRVVMLTSQGFTKKQIQQGASSLTYYTLLGIVPMIALILAIARGFLLEKSLHEVLANYLSVHDEIFQKIIEFAQKSLEATKGGIVAGIGIVLLFWAGIKILLNIERVMNQIWEVKQGRSLARKFSDYLAMIILCPIILLLASGLTVYLSTAITTLAKKGKFIGEVAPFFLTLTSLIPFLLICLLFTFLYIFMPNTRVRFLPAFGAGFFTGIIYQAIQWLYLYFQIGVTSYNAIYGTFAALPLFLIWLHLSWVIILIGAKLSFASQNANTFQFLTENVHLSHRFRSLLSLRITHFCIKKFVSGDPPPSTIEISNQLAIPHHLTSHLLYALVESSVLSEIKRDTDKDPGFQPARDVDHLTIKLVLDMINQRGEEIPLPPSDELNLILSSLDKFSQAIETSDGNILLKIV